ncbi:MAG TPA: VOC family protein [Solirubrobacterales bacterium]|jgi:catechol 2,3-dioxygenase-like lactoylglutathione lyase family enzyme
MLDASKAYSGFAVTDTEQAKQFYGDKLGLDIGELDVGAPVPLLELRLGDRNVLIYPKPDLEPANYTILNFPVDDIDGAVDELASKGVTFERYEEFEQDEKGIDRSGPAGGIAWFKDPAGNILAVHGQM